MIPAGGAWGEGILGIGGWVLGNGITEAGVQRVTNAVRTRRVWYFMKFRCGTNIFSPSPNNALRLHARPSNRLCALKRVASAMGGGAIYFEARLPTTSRWRMTACLSTR